MEYLPGTTVEVNANNSAQGFLDSAFAMNGLVLSQIVQITGLEPHTIQNWVKRGFLSPPVQKKYDVGQFCRIAVVNMLKDIFNIERIVSMLKYVEDAEPAVSDTVIYIAFSDVMNALPRDAIEGKTDIDRAIDGVLAGLELRADTKERLHKVIKVMVLAFISARVGRRADMFLRQIEDSY